MKSFKIGLLAALFAALWLAGTAQAGQREGAFSLSPMVGYHWFEGDQNTDDGWAAGMSLGYNLTKHWAAELEGRYTKSDPPPGNTQDLEIAAVGVNALYHFSPDGPFVPYVSAGFGAMFFNWGAVDNDSDDEDYFMNWGLGAKYFLTEDVALRADVRHIIDLHSDRAWDQQPDSDDTDHNIVATAGLYFQFGGPAPPPPPPADSDGDGIPDIRDKCPDTPLGVMVDAVGCPPMEKAPPPPPPKKPMVEKPVPVVEKEIITFNLIFGFDKHEITEEMIPVLEQAKSILDEDPAAAFIVSGHTCSIGTDEYNQSLSERRAASVKNWLVDNGIAENRLQAAGYGEAQPKYDNSTKEGRKLNRRVEIMTHEN